MIKVLFVCLGNICRSPMAEAIFKKKVKDANLETKFEIDSAGTGDWHIGREPHEGTLNILKENEIDSAGMKARQVKVADLTKFDYIICMDAQNIGNIQRMKGLNESGQINRLLDFLPESEIEDVPDPYYTGNFQEVYQLVDEACTELLHTIISRKNS